MLKEKIKEYQEKEGEKASLESELNRIDAFQKRDKNNKDTNNSLSEDKTMIMVKFGGTACMLPVSLFNQALEDRKAEINQRLTNIENELNAL